MCWPRLLGARGSVRLCGVMAYGFRSSVSCGGDFTGNDEGRATTSLALNLDSFLEEGLGPTIAFSGVGGVLGSFQGVAEKMAVVPAGGFMVGRQDVPEQGGFVSAEVFMQDIPTGATSMLASEGESLNFGSFEDVIAEAVTRPGNTRIKAGGSSEPKPAGGHMCPFVGGYLEGFRRLIIFWLKELGRLEWLYLWKCGLVHKGSFCVRGVSGDRFRVGWGGDRGVRAHDNGRCGVGGLRHL